MMKKRWFLLPAILYIVIAVPMISEGSVNLFGAHYLPADITEGDEVDFFIMVRDAENTGIERVYLQLEDEEYEMQIINDSKVGNWSEGILYHAKVKVEFSGNINLTYHSRSTNGNISNSDVITLAVEKKGKEDTILGMPKTYCAISVIFITLMIIFLTWSYFKGRRMQKGMEHVTGDSKMACSACGANISSDDEKCPKCGAVFEEEEHICGNCGEIISENDIKCGKCGTKLKSPSNLQKDHIKKKVDPDINKLHKRVDMKGKVECGKCGVVFLEKEGKCPECGRKS